MDSNQAPARTISLTEEEPVSILDGALDWIPLRRRLGITAFGTNAYRAARAGDVVIEEHAESPGQEELYVVVTGRARIVVDGQEFDCGVGTALFVDQPDLMRSGVALEDDTLVLAVGGWPGRAYHSLPWEPIFLAQPAMRAGDWAAAAKTLEREAGEHRETPIVRYRLACCLARSGELDRALSELREAIAGNPDFAGRAADEDHFAALHGTDGWAELVSRG